MAYEVNRSFAHKRFGDIGAVALVIDGDKWTLDGKALPEASIAYLATFALQSLQDAYAGSESADDAVAAFTTKRDKLIEGTIGTRGSGDGADERTRVARSIMRRVAKDKFGSKSPEWATFTGLADAEQNKKLDAWFAANEKALSAEVEAEMTRRAEARASKTKLSGKVAIDL